MSVGIVKGIAPAGGVTVSEQAQLDDYADAGDRLATAGYEEATLDGSVAAALTALATAQALAATTGPLPVVIQRRVRRIVGFVEVDIEPAVELAS